MARVWEAYFNRFVASPIDGAPSWSADGLPPWSQERERVDAERNKGHEGERTDGEVAAQRQMRSAGRKTADGTDTVHTLEKIAGNTQRGLAGAATRRPQMVEPIVKFDGWLTYGERFRKKSFERFGQLMYEPMH